MLSILSCPPPVFSFRKRQRIVKQPERPFTFYYILYLLEICFLLWGDYRSKVYKQPEILATSHFTCLRVLLKGSMEKFGRVSARKSRESNEKTSLFSQQALI